MKVVLSFLACSHFVNVRNEGLTDKWVVVIPIPISKPLPYLLPSGQTMWRVALPGTVSHLSLNSDRAFFVDVAFFAIQFF